MKIVISIDSFKGSLSSLDAGNACRRGILRAIPDAEIHVRPLADGGEGTAEVLSGDNITEAFVTGPNGQKVKSYYGILKQDGKETAIIEMATAAGLTLIPKDERNPMYTTTYGVGELIKLAINQGIRDFIIGIGGSATNDGGVGMLTALGFAFMDDRGNPIESGAIGLSKLSKIDTSKAMPELCECRFRVACDVNNPLCGELGCSVVFSPQKGAKAEDIEKMDKWLNQYAKLTKALIPDTDPDMPGSGAAGGLGFALRSYLGATLESGISLILDAIRLEDIIRDADIVVTGEGRLDAQTSMGKVPTGVAKLAKRYNKPCIAFSGCVTRDARECNKHGIDAFFPILREVCSLDEAMDNSNARMNLEDTAEQVFRLLALK